MYNVLCFEILLLISLNVINCQDLSSPGTKRVVTTGVGDIEGSFDSDGGYYKFLGIPYGQVNEDNPFGDSTRYPAFDGVFKANVDAVSCPQISGGKPIGEIDCLNLNVYVPANANATSRLPVIIWVHGGFFMSGSASESVYGPKYLVRNDVVVVSIAYRIGPFGFMCLGINTVPGNQGLKDQHLAIQWVKSHIEAFGGNPDEITLAGNSAGGHSIDLHLIADREPLFNKVIIQSGSAQAATVFIEPEREAAIKIAEHIGIQLKSNHSREAISLLAALKDAHSIVKAANELNLSFKPCVEYPFEGGSPFISQDWVKAPVHNVRGKSVLIGFNEFETIAAHTNQDSEYFENLDIITENLNSIYDFNDERIIEENRLEKMEEDVRHFYMGDNAYSQDVLWPIINFHSDFLYIHPIQRSIKKFLEGEARNIFYYMFAYSGGRNQRTDQNNVPIIGAAHTDECKYLFDSAFVPEEVSASDQLVIDRMTTMWTNFAKYGDPTPPNTDLLSLKWTPLTRFIYHYMKIDSDLAMERRPFNKRMAFLDLFFKYNNDFLRTYDPYFENDGFDS